MPLYSGITGNVDVPGNLNDQEVANPSPARTTPTTALGTLAVLFPRTWSAFGELWGMDTESLCAAGVAGTIIAVVHMYTQMMMGFQTVNQYSVSTASEVHMYAAAIFGGAVFGVFSVQRAVSRVLYFQRLPCAATADALAASPTILKMCSFAAVVLAIGATFLSSDPKHVIPVSVLYSAAVAFGVQELLAELFPSQVYRRGRDEEDAGAYATNANDEGTLSDEATRMLSPARSSAPPLPRLSPTAYNKLAPTAVYTTVLLFVTYACAVTVNLLVFGMGMSLGTDAGTFGSRFNRSNVAFLYLFGACGVALVMAVRSVVPCGRTRRYAVSTEQQRQENRPLIEFAHGAYV